MLNIDSFNYITCHIRLRRLAVNSKGAIARLIVVVCRADVTYTWLTPPYPSLLACTVYVRVYTCCSFILVLLLYAGNTCTIILCVLNWQRSTTVSTAISPRESIYPGLHLFALPASVTAPQLFSPERHS